MCFISAGWCRFSVEEWEERVRSREREIGCFFPGECGDGGLWGCRDGGAGRQELLCQLLQTIARRQSYRHLSLQSVVEDCSVLSAKVASCAGCVKQHFFFQKKYVSWSLFFRL